MRTGSEHAQPRLVAVLYVQGQAHPRAVVPRDIAALHAESVDGSLSRAIIAKLEGADPARAVFLAVWHDTGETRTGDVNHLGKKYTAGEADPRDITADQVAGMPGILAEALTELVAEYEAKDSPEAICARDADKLECMIQGIEYKAQGYENAQRWIDNSHGRIVAKAGNALADAVLETGSLDWLRSALGEKQG